jgi:hypothetical protein
MEYDRLIAALFLSYFSRFAAPRCKDMTNSAPPSFSRTIRRSRQFYDLDC